MVAKTTIDRLGKRTSSTSAGKHRRGRRALTGTRTYCGDRVAGEYEWGRLVRRGDDPGLPHRSAKELANASGLRHGLGAAAEDRADRRRETLREAELHRVRGRRELARIDAERDRRVEDTRAVQVDAQPPAVREVGDRGGLVGRQDAAAAVVVRVLETHERRSREHARRPYRGLDVGERGAALAVRHEPWLDRAEDEGGAHLVLIDVREVAEDDLVAALGLRQDATQVPEHAARDVDRGLLAEDLGGPLFKPVHGRILAVLVVADLGLRHRAAHRGGREREGIAPQLERLRAHAPMASFMTSTTPTMIGAIAIAGRKSATCTSRIFSNFKPTPRMRRTPTE